MPTYLEKTRRQLAAEADLLLPSYPADLSKQEKVKLKTNNHNVLGNVVPALNALGAAGWELVAVTEIKEQGGEILYTFMKP